MKRREATPDQLARALDEGRVQLLDVRTALEFSTGHIAQAQNRPLGQVTTDGLDPEREVWLICRSGGRSARAAEDLAGQGFSVVNVTGGMNAWNGPVEGRAWWSGLPLPLLGSVTLGLAPFVPEPHIVGKLRWAAGGGVGMAPMDVFDLLMHGAPWVWLAIALVRALRRR